ncbi:MAG: hypothetical protein FD149_2159, partial [Rhodospirillaceae bacterium]
MKGLAVHGSCSEEDLGGSYGWPSISLEWPSRGGGAAGTPAGERQARLDDFD